MWCIELADATQEAHFGLSQRHYLDTLPGLSLERTTGFEPATLTLAIKFRCELPTCTYTNSRSMIGVFG